MDERELYAQLSELLAAELADRIPVLNQVLLALERGPATAEQLHELHRLIHVVKGASRSAGALPVEAACHELETLLVDVVPGLPLPPAITAAGLAFADQLERARGQLLAGQPVSLESEAPVESDPGVPVDLDLMTSHSADVLLAHQRLADPIAALGELRVRLERGSPTPTQVAGVARGLAQVHRELARGLAGLDLAAKQLDEQVLRMRLRSIGDASQGCDRIVHDVALSLGKLAALELVGAEVRIDRAHVDVLREVLVQLVRNAVVHGIELPAERAARGKPDHGRITIEAAAEGDSIRILVNDDGGGLDLAAIGQGNIFAPGFSTAKQVTEHAGRGVGLDVAKQRIEALHGSISVASTPGAGTTFTIQLPTTVATILALVVEVAGVAYALPTGGVERVARADTAAFQRVDDRTVVKIGDTWVPVDELGRVLGETVTPRSEPRAMLVVLAQGARRVAVVVDRMLGIRDLAIGGLGARLPHLRHVTGQARLPSGQITVVLSTADVIDDTLDGRAPLPIRVVAAVKRHRILLADDSATTRALETNILRSAGYEVITAVDGQDALRQLDDTIDLVVSDVDMPNLDGFGLAEAVRSREDAPPVVLVTARSTDADRAKGLRVGASAFLVKSSFDQTLLLQTIERLL